MEEIIKEIKVMVERTKLMLQTREENEDYFSCCMQTARYNVVIERGSESVNRTLFLQYAKHGV